MAFEKKYSYRVLFQVELEIRVSLKRKMKSVSVGEEAQDSQVDRPTFPGNGLFEFIVARMVYF